jgi:hypothetical protein
MNFREALRRPDWLAELHGLLLLAVVASGIGVVAGLVATVSGQPLEVEVAADGAVWPHAPAGVSVATALQLEVRYPSAAQLAWAILAELPRHLLILTALVLLWRLVGRARRADPFRSGLAVRFRGLGLLLAVGGPVVWALECVARFALSDTVGVGGAYLDLDFSAPVTWLLCGVGAFATGEIVRRGQAMRTELDGVV